jgi:undecaprenyl diphosphate synthase
MSLSSRIKNEAIDFVSQTTDLNLPKALLIIPDGNGRWAKSLGLSISEGHKAGGKTISEILDHFMKTNIEYLGIWGFSEDNWKREKQEIDKIMEVIELVIKENLGKLMKNNIKFIVLGKKDRIKNEYPTLFSSIENTQNQTLSNNGKKLVLFIDYGERFQLEEFAKEREKDRKTSTYELLSKLNSGVPLFDMVLRTSGEKRLSGFGPLASLAEFVSVKKNLPDLNDKDILLALKEYSGRHRRLGGR